MRRLALLAAALLGAPSAAAAAPTLYGVNFIGTSVYLDPRAPTLPPGAKGQFQGTFTFDNDTNQLLSFNAFELPGISPSNAVVSLFNAAEPCNLACFIGALESGSFVYTYNIDQAYISFGNPLNGYVVVSPPSGIISIRNTVSGVIRFGGEVPEPSTWLLMLGGFGVIGASMRRRYSVSSKKLTA